MEVVDALILLATVAEFALLAVLERRLWGTIYTPLNILMIPFAIVAAISIAMLHIYDLYPFNYYTLVVWDVGLLFFFIPSALLQLLKPKGNNEIDLPKPDIPFKPIAIGALAIVLLLYAWHIRSAAMSGEAVMGTDDFAEKTSVNGVWGHTFTFLLAVEMICARYLSRKNRWLIIPIFIIIVFAVINQVKGYMIVPLCAIVIMNLIEGRLHIRLKTILLWGGGGFGFFFLSYYISLALSQDKGLEDHLINFIISNFLHYLSSGVLGLSVDLDKGVLEHTDWQYFFAPFVNVIRTLIGEKLYDHNLQFFFKTTWYDLGTNVRSFMGVLYVYGGMVVGPAIAMLISVISYGLRLAYLHTRRSLWLISDAWWCALLFMGWFHYHFVLLRSLEVPFLIVFVAMVANFLGTKRPKEVGA